MFDKIQIILMMKTTISNNRISPLNKVTSPLTFFLRQQLFTNNDFWMKTGLCVEQSHFRKPLENLQR